MAPPPITTTAVLPSRPSIPRREVLRARWIERSSKTAVRSGMCAHTARRAHTVKNTVLDRPVRNNPTPTPS